MMHLRKIYRFFFFFKDANPWFCLCVSGDLHQGSKLAPCIPECCERGAGSSGLRKGKQGGNEVFLLHSRGHKAHFTLLLRWAHCLLPSRDLVWRGCSMAGFVSFSLVCFGLWPMCKSQMEQFRSHCRCTESPFEARWGGEKSKKYRFSAVKMWNTVNYLIRLYLI